MTASDVDPTPGERARRLLIGNPGDSTAIARASVWATIEVAAAVDRQTAVLGRVVDSLELRRAP